MGIGNVCSECIGVDKCNKYCRLNAGLNIVNFIKSVDVVDTQIGELRPARGSVKNSLIVTGHLLDSGGAPTYIMSDANNGIDISGKFKNYDNATPQQLLKQYIDTLDLSKEVKENSIKTFRKFNSNQLLPIPLKVGAECEVNYSSKNRNETIKTKINSIIWNIDKETGKLACNITCPAEKGVFESDRRMIKIPITEYGTKIKLPQLERVLTASSIDRDLIKMSPVGFIKPVVVEDGKNTLAIDGQHLYKVTDDGVIIIGTWKNGKMTSLQGGIEPVQRTKAYKKIHGGIKYVEKHIRFIAPYGLFEANHIVLD